MKRYILICCVLFFCSTLLYAQVRSPSPPRTFNFVKNPTKVYDFRVTFLSHKEIEHLIRKNQYMIVHGFTDSIIVYSTRNLKKVRRIWIKKSPISEILKVPRGSVVYQLIHIQGVSMHRIGFSFNSERHPRSRRRTLAKHFVKHPVRAGDVLVLKEWMTGFGEDRVPPFDDSSLNNRAYWEMIKKLDRKHGK